MSKLVYELPADREQCR